MPGSYQGASSRTHPNSETTDYSLNSEVGCDGVSIKTTSQNAAEGSRILRSFMLMSVSFSITHGAVAVVVGFAGADFKTMGNASNGVLYATYCISALFFSKVIVNSLGLKTSLIAGVVQYCLYLLCYTLAIIIGDGQESAHLFIIVGAGMGGIAAGYFWVAEGAYFTLSAKQYAVAMGISEKEATGLLSSYFAACYLFWEVCFKFVGGAIKAAGNEHGTQSMYVLCCGVGFCSAALMALINDPSLGSYNPSVSKDYRTAAKEKLESSTTVGGSSSSKTEQACSACTLLLRDPKVNLCMLLFLFVFLFFCTHADASFLC
jgi:hypothetical protein